MSEHNKAVPGIAHTVKHTLKQSRWLSPARLSKDLQNTMQQLRRHYIAANINAARPPQDEWLCDNYYVLEKESKQSQKEIVSLCRNKRGKAGADELGMLATVVVAVVTEEMPTIDDDSVITILDEIQKHHPLSELQFSFLPCAIKIALIKLAHKACLELHSEKEIAYAIVGLAKLTSVDFDSIIRRCSAVEGALSHDPAGAYQKMTEESRRYYRYLTARIALETGKSELDCVKELLQDAKAQPDGPRRHVGYGILHHPCIRGPKIRRGKWALALSGILPLLAALVLAVACRTWWVGLFCFLPLWEILRPLIQQGALSEVDVDYLPRMDLSQLEEKPKTVVLVSTLLPKAGDAPRLAERLEQLYFSNSDPDLYFCILADFKEWDFPTDEKDDSQVEASCRVIEQLNKRYGERFQLFLRGRTYNKAQGKYSGWERKRGAITEFIRFLKGEQTSVHTFVGERSVLGKIRYVIALDADTALLYESAQTLVSVAMHPLNWPIINEDGIVATGYGILAPKITTDLPSAKATAFSRVLSGAGGVTAYETKDKDFYQDLFFESIFAGKGLIDIEAFYSVLNSHFPDNQVLSHDILEGAYLRCGFVSDVEMTDQTPAGMTSWLARLHRWIRGDWQNIPFLAAAFQVNGQKRDNPISHLSKYKLFDNLRRSLAPVTGLLCVVAALFAPDPTSGVLAVTGILAVTFSSLWAATCSLMSGGVFTLSRKFFTRTLSHTFELLAQGLFFLIMMPVQAFSAVDAAIRSLWRTFVSHKKLLEWTTAAQSDMRKITWGACLRRYWPAELFGILYMLLTLDSPLCLLGLVFALVLPVAYYSALPTAEEKHSLPLQDRDALLSYNAAMWRYYEDFANAANHFLPPDNVQQSPVYRVATRTSPTNIGMMMLSTLAARDFDLIDTQGLYTRIERTLTTVEKLEKWKGNLYNWYDTETLELLHPAFVSTVDSGNFIGSMVALKEGLREFLPENPAFGELIRRVENLIDNTDLTPFYNKKKHLFSIGWDCEREELSGSHYDFLMSEARLTSYYAVARKIVGKKHWGCMGRAMSRSGSYAGPVSWTGTMFEYYMPHLLLPVYEGSLISEALTYCLYCQKKWAREKEVPWGISESAFYAFDNNLNYQYKAHGVQKVGVKRYLDRELVISPYSTFITISQNPNSSMENLRRLRELGVYGRYGFYEAVDFTPSRVGQDALAVTRSYMAHHIGMSMLASCNALFENRMQRRFMRDCYMHSAKEFLQEKIAKSTVVYDQMKNGELRSEKQERPRRLEETTEISPVAPRCTLLTNGELTDILTDAGPGNLKFGDVDLTRRSADLLRHSQGLLALVRTGNLFIPATMAPFYEPGVEYKVEHQEQSVTYFARKKDIEVGLRCVVHPTLSCGQRQLVVKNHGAKRQQTQVLLYFEPVLASWAGYSAHPAYSKLFVTAGYNPQSRTLTFTRRSRDSGGGMCLTVGFLEDLPFSFETHREQLMSAPEGVGGLRSFQKVDFSNRDGGVPDTCCALRFDMSVGGGSQKQATLLLSASRDEAEGVANIISMRKIGVLDPKHAAKSPLPADSLEGRLGSSILGQLLFAQGVESPNIEEKRMSNQNQSGLWRTGISGDNPIVLVDGAEELDPDTLGSYLRMHAALRNVNITFDLVILYTNEETRELLIQRLSQESVPSILGARGGVFLLDWESLEPETIILLRAVARHLVKGELPPVEQQVPGYRPVKLRPVEPAPMPPSTQLTVQGGAVLDGRFYVDKSSPLPYSHILAGPSFGTLLSDRALGYTWAFNSRENKLTPWYNDICADNTGEMLLLRQGDDIHDLVNGSRASFSPADARYQGRAAKIETAVTVTVAEKGCAKYMDVDLNNTGKESCELLLAYYTEPVLGVTRETARFVKTRVEMDTMILENSYTIAMRSAAAITAMRKRGEAPLKPRFMTSRPAFLSGEWDSQSILPQEDPCAAVIIPVCLRPGERAGIRFVLSAGRSPEGAVAMASLSMPTDFAPSNRLEISTPEGTLDEFINHFAPHQILASRIRGRTAFYQCGGAFGFRDQLQDACAYLLLEPEVARRQILRCCAVQFEEGDVLHWWHVLPGGPRGVRTRFSDDLLWLPLAATEYVQKTGDGSILDIPIHYLTAEPLGPREQERYISPGRSPVRESVFEHCVKALDKGYHVDSRGLPYIGCGDWNDGLSHLGAEGKGVSVWLALFLVYILERFAHLCDQRGEERLAGQCKERAAGLKAAVDEHCWDGQWYIRAFFDDGRPMGSKNSMECNIDLLPQSFAVLSGMPDKARVEMGMESAWQRLTDQELRLVKLFTPPFQHSDQQPGYLKAYPSGIRENGGQYTHAAIWFALALLEGETQQSVDRGWQILEMLSPLNRSAQEELAKTYKLEPYYIAADIYTNPNAPGRGGWSMYTGAAAWYYRVVVESLLGLKMRGSELHIFPRIPSHWKNACAQAEIRGTILDIQIVRGEQAGILCDGQEVMSVPLNGGRHDVKVTVL